MKTRLLIACLLWLGLAQAVFAAQALDGAVQNGATSGGAVTLALTTTGGSGVIVVLCLDSNSSGTRTVTGGTLSFANRVAPSSSPAMGEWTAPYTSNFSGTITYSNSSGLGGFGACVAFGISGSPTSSYFDPNVGLPIAISGSGGASVATNDAATFIFAYMGNNNAAPTAGSGWTTLPGGGSWYQGAQYKIVTSAQTSLAVTWSGAGAITGTIADAIISSTQPPPSTGSGKRMLLGVGK